MYLTIYICETSKKLNYRIRQNAYEVREKTQIQQ